MSNRRHKIKVMSLSDSNAKTSLPPAKRFQIAVFIHQIAKFFGSSHNPQEKPDKAENCTVLPSISVTNPDGQTIVVE
ncbi:unnamed protein product [Adineta ricciae]|uniref:Uncharacterized protein n=1 Tax=Adineta ricciae TaxID=249248 RepID=A0A815EZM6_ADIRI|nr:unnamed protein product [Adineta ricciae]